MELPASIVRVMRDIKDGISVSHNMGSRDDGYSGFVLERPFFRQLFSTSSLVKQFNIALERLAHATDKATQRRIRSERLFGCGHNSTLDTARALWRASDVKRRSSFLV